MPNIPIRLEVKAVPKSGGHEHYLAGDDRPTGHLSNGITSAAIVDGVTGPNGRTFNFLSSDPAGDHEITATCLGDNRCRQEGPKVIWVGVKGLVHIPPSSAYVLMPNADTFHPDNHYMTPLAIQRLAKLATLYRGKFPNDSLLRLNDASLVRGGLFDSKARFGLRWQQPHRVHRFGLDIDIRANPSVNPSTSIPEANFKKFIELVRQVGGGTIPANGPAYGGTDNQHFHVCMESPCQ